MGKEGEPVEIDVAVAGALDHRDPEERQEPARRLGQRMKIQRYVRARARQKPASDTDKNPATQQRPASAAAIWKACRVSTLVPYETTPVGAMSGVTPAKLMNGSASTSGRSWSTMESSQGIANHRKISGGSSPIIRTLSIMSATVAISSSGNCGSSASPG